MPHLPLLLLLLLPGGPPAKKMYICQGSASYAYHATARCEGLAWCTRTVKALTEQQAVKLGRRPCGRCIRH